MSKFERGLVLELPDAYFSPELEYPELDEGMAVARLCLGFSGSVKRMRPSLADADGPCDGVVITVDSVCLRPKLGVSVAARLFGARVDVARNRPDRGVAGGLDSGAVPLVHAPELGSKAKAAVAMDGAAATAPGAGTGGWAGMGCMLEAVDNGGVSADTCRAGLVLVVVPVLAGAARTSEGMASDLLLGTGKVERPGVGDTGTEPECVGLGVDSVDCGAGGADGAGGGTDGEREDVGTVEQSGSSGVLLVSGASVR